MKTTLEYVQLDWYSEDQDNFDIGLKFSIHINYDYTMPPRDEGFGRENVVFTSAYINDVNSPQLLLEAKTNSSLQEHVADYLNEHWDDIQDVLKEQHIDPEIA